jgi:carboxypeptidase T
MEIQSSPQAPRSFTLEAATKGQERPVADTRLGEALIIDTNKDGVCSDSEIEAYMRARNIIHQGGESNIPALVGEYKAHLTNSPSDRAGGYRSLEQLEDRMKELAADHSDRVQMVSIAKTTEGRDVWALKVTSNAQADTSNKPGIVITGTHHSREWATPEVTLDMADELIHSYDSNPDSKRRLDNGELWFIPVLNPDGFQYSKTDDNMWRKNRTPVMTLPNGKASPDGKPLGYGVDPNRNYWDGNPDHMQYFRADGDTPTSTSDDIGASDDPNDETFRGNPGQEPEIKGVMNLEYHHGNIHGVLDHHSYGNQLLYPWGHTHEPPPQKAAYDEVGKLMQGAQKAAKANVYEYVQSVTDYPTYGSSETCHEANGILNFTVEMGDSFQPNFKDVKKIYNAVNSADLAFVDYIESKFPVQAPPAPPSQDPTPAPQPTGGSQDPTPAPPTQEPQPPAQASA